MPRTARRALRALRLEALEPRRLPSASVQGVNAGPPQPASPADTLMVRFAAGVPAASAQAELAAVGGRVLQSFPDGPSVVALAPGVSPSAAIATLRADRQVLYAEPDGTIHGTDINPTDPMFGALWGMNNPNNVDIDAPQAWTVTTGNPSTIIAVLDTGIDLNNPEFAGRIWTNPNPWHDPGFFGDVNGWNFVSNTGFVQDNNGHGTHVSGTIGADPFNGIGVAGVNWQAKIMPVKILDGSGNGTTDEAVAGIYFAVNHGARVINASWGGGDFSQSMIDAINYADSRGVVFVVAAGNDGTDNDFVANFPASYRLPNEIVVGAIDSSGNLAEFSNYGAGTVDLAAPGVNIVSTVPGGYASYSGTSMATPHVTGVVSLVLGLHPTYSAEALIHQVLAGVKPLPSLMGKTGTGGMVDAYGALVGPGVISAAGTGAGPVLVPGGTLDAVVQAQIAQWAQQDNGAFVTELFQAFLGRTPDPIGYNHFVTQLQQGASRFAVAQAVQNSPEARALEVARWYRDALGVSNVSLGQLEADPGVAAWGAQLASNGPDTVLAGILSTDAYAQAQGGTNAGFVNGLFWALLGRAPDPVGFGYFLGLLQQGMSRFDVARAMQATAEAKATKVARWFQDEYGSTRTLGALKADGYVNSWAGWLGSF
jgi:subtilisin family serine protease